MKKDITTRLESIKDYIDTHANVETCIDVDFAESIDVLINNNEEDVAKFELFSQPKNSDLALAILDF